MVVLPFVPVTPATTSSSLGRPKNSSAAAAIAARASGTTSCGTGEVERPLDDEPDRAALDRLRREVVPVGARARNAEEAGVARASTDRAVVRRGLAEAQPRR